MNLLEASAWHPVLGLPGLTEMWPILIIVLLLFGGRKLPELARSMGSSITQFRRGLKDAETELDEAKRLEPKDENGASKSE